MSGRNDGVRVYWRTTLRILMGLLAVWFVVSFGLGIILVEPLNAIKVGGFPLGFWFAQQGAIYIFIALILIYALWMDRADAALAVSAQAEPHDLHERLDKE